MQRPQWLSEKFRRELKGWNQEVLDTKLENLAKVIGKMNEGKGPDILGVGEIENISVLEMLLGKLSSLGRHYRILHNVMQASWGVDVSFIYDAGKYSRYGETTSFEVLSREVPRNIFGACFSTSSDKVISVIANHWPGRSEANGSADAERIIAAKALNLQVENILKMLGKEAPIVVLGDFNEQPFAPALTQFALSSQSKNKVLHGQRPHLYNLMWPLLGERKGSYVNLSDPLMHDQILVSKGVVSASSGFALTSDSAILEGYDALIEGRYDKPIRFGRPSKPRFYNLEGCSDHLPVSVVLQEKV